MVDINANIWNSAFGIFADRPRLQILRLVTHLAFRRSSTFRRSTCLRSVRSWSFLERSAFADLMAQFPNTKTYLEGLSDRRLKQIGEALRPAEIIDADELVVEAEEPAAGKP